MLIAGNWKMHTDLTSAATLAKQVASRISTAEGVTVAVCPPFVSLDAVFGALRGSGVRLGAQNMHAEDEGAYTGEVSALMLRSVGCDYVILGHSERRQYFGESDDDVLEKVKQALRHELIPIVCIGEKLEERKAGRHEDVVARQLDGALDGVEISDGEQLVIAYEPVWAIGTGETATPEQAQEMHAFVRSQMADRFGESVAAQIEILYGGSMKPHNAGELLSQPDVDGGLVGGASLNADDFTAIVESALVLEQE